MTLAPVDPTSAVAVTDYLTRAREWLSTAVENSTPHGIAGAKAELNVAAEATKQLGLSKEIQLDAQEMVRRAEYALGKAIRKGQAEGTVYAPGKNPAPEREYVRNGYPVRGAVDRGDSSSGVPVTDLATKSDLYNTKGNIMDLAQATPAELDEALEEARAEGNLSRANVARKVGRPIAAVPTNRDQRADLIADLAAQGYSSRQMPSKVGVTEEVVRRIARDFDIDIPADKVIGRTRRLDHTHMVASTVNDLVLATEFIEAQIDLSEVDFAEADEWLSSLTHSIRALNRFKQQIKEHSHV